MNKKIIFLVILQVYLFATVAVAQTCFGTLPTCLSTAEQHVNQSGSAWHPSHGASIFSSTNHAPTSPSSSGSLSMWSFAFLNKGSGAFTCFNFQQGHTYRVCYWVRNTSGMFGDPLNPWGTLKVYAADGLVANGNPVMEALPTVNKQLIDDSYYGPAQSEADPVTGECEWEFFTATFTADDDYTNLWLYAYNPMGYSAPGSLFWHPEYSVEVDDIRVYEEPTPPAPYTITASKDPIAGCNDYATLTIDNLPAGYLATWPPLANIFPVTPNWSQVIVSPCSTTTYKVLITDPTASSSSPSYCANCIREVLYYTVNVNQWSDPVKVISPTSLINCGGSIDLDYNDAGHPPCGVTYTWYDPQNNAYSGKTHDAFTNPIIANSSHTGEWRLEILIGSKGCVEVHKFFVKVGSCCQSNPSFTFTPNTNPVIFTNTSTGIINNVGVLWNFGDGTTSTLANPIHTFAPNKTYQVCLTMLYNDGQGETCCNQICEPVVIGPNTTGNCIVNADFTATPVPGWGNMFDFADISAGNGTLCEFEWIFGDGSTTITNVPTIRHQYFFANPGPWWACVIVTNCVYDANGILVTTCKDTKCMWIDPVELVSNPGAGTPDQGTRPPMADNPFDNGESQPQTGVNLPIAPGNEMALYPNPNYGSFSLNLYKRKGNYQVVVHDQLGREVYKQTHVFDTSPVKITLGDVSNGVYSVEVFNEKEKFVQQISIAK